MKNFVKLFSAFLLLAIISIAAIPVERKKEAKKPVQVEQTLNQQEVSADILTVEAISEIAVAQDLEVEEVITTPALLNSGKSQLVALLLVLFVGVLGIHRFYLGYTGIGIIQLLTGGGCGIWALIDLIMIITGDLKPKDGEYTTKL